MYFFLRSKWTVKNFFKLPFDDYMEEVFYSEKSDTSKKKCIDCKW